MSQWHSILQWQACPAGVGRELDEIGFSIIAPEGACADVERMQTAYDRAISSARPDEVSVRSSTRLHDFVNRGAEFDHIYVNRVLLAASARIIGRPFKLSSMLGRTLEPDTPAQPLHVDVKRTDQAWPLAGFILMIDEFRPDNEATRFVPASHRRSGEPGESKPDSAAPPDQEVLACGAAGSMIIFNGSVWHGHTANRSAARRRSIQGAFIPRDAPSATDQASCIRSETLARISELAKYVLALPDRPPN